MTSASEPSVSIVIPVLNAAAFLPTLMPALLCQGPVPPMEILILDSGSRDGTVALAAAYERTRVIKVDKFSHSRTRNLGIAQAMGDIVVLMTQDALPANPDWLHELTLPFRTPSVAATFSRQIPRADANPMERFFLATHFPETGKTYRRQPGQQHLAFQREVFLSNVSAALRREVALQHPFEGHLIMSEDQQFARDVLMADLEVRYIPSSVVLHSHNYTCMQALKRYFDGAYSLTQIFSRHDLLASLQMGSQYIKCESWMMIRHHQLWLLRYLGFVLAKSLGTFLGHFAARLPLWLTLRLSQHAYYWRQT